MKSGIKSSLRHVLSIDFGSSQIHLQLASFDSAGKPTSEPVPVSVSFGIKDGCIPSVFETDASCSSTIAAGCPVLQKLKTESASSHYNFYPESPENTLLWIEQFLEYLASELMNSDNKFPFSANGDIAIVAGTPVFWKAANRSRLKEIIRKAFDNPRVGWMSGPEALLSYHLWKQEIPVSDKPENILIVDFGASRTDIALARTVPDLENMRLTKMPSQDERYGGTHFDALFVKFVADSLNISGEDRDLPALQVIACEFKEKFSRAMNSRKNSFTSEITFTGASGQIHSGNVSLNRASFEKESFAGELITEYLNMIQRSLVEFRVRSEDIYSVIAAGGSSSWYFVRNALASQFPKTPLLLSPEPASLIAKGLAVAPVFYPTLLIAEKEVAPQKSKVKLIQAEVMLSWEEASKGCEKKTAVAGSFETISIPSGVRDGDIISIPQSAPDDAASKRTGTLEVRVKVAPRPVAVLEKMDIAEDGYSSAAEQPMQRKVLERNALIIAAVIFIIILAPLAYNKFKPQKEIAKPTLQINSFTCDPAKVAPGDRVNLTWDVSPNCRDIVLMHRVGIGGTDVIDQKVDQHFGSLSMLPFGPQTIYTLVVHGSNGEKEASQTTTVDIDSTLKRNTSPNTNASFAIRQIAAAPLTVTAGQPVRISWEVTGQKALFFSPGNIPLNPTDMTRVERPMTDTEFKIRAINGYGQALEKSIKVKVSGAATKLPVISSFSINPESVVVGEKASLQWSARDAAQLSIISDDPNISIGKVPLGDGTLPIIFTSINAVKFTLLASDAANKSVTKTLLVTPRLKSTESRAANATPKGPRTGGATRGQFAQMFYDSFRDTINKFPGGDSSVFPDVTPNTPNAAAINALSERGLIDSGPDGLYRSASVLKRYDLANYLKRLMNKLETTSSPANSVLPIPKDLSTDSPYFSDVSELIQKGVLKALPDGSFHGGQAATIEDIRNSLTRLHKAAR